MKTNITVEYKGNYIHAVQSGSDSYDASLELWQRIVDMCKEQGCFNVFGETFTTKPLSTMDAFDHIKIFELAGVTLKHRIAWVHHVEETADAMRFAETVLLNRGLVNGRLFPNVREAKEWLLGKEADKKQDASDG